MPPPELESNVAERLSAEDLLEAWHLLVSEDRLDSFLALPRPEAEDLFLSLSAHDQAELLFALPQPERRLEHERIAQQRDQAAQVARRVQEIGRASCRERV